jgi:hypothetical protein
MKRLNKNIELILLLIFLVTSFNSNSQDIVKFNTGDSIICRVTEISEDTVFMSTKVRDKTVKTFIDRSKVKDIKLFAAEYIQKNNDTSAFYSVILNDGTGLTGKVLNIEEYTLRFDDNNFGKIDISVFDVESIEKEDNNLLYLIKLTDGNQLYGKILERRKSEIDFETKTLGKVTVPVANIKKMQQVDEGEMKGGKYWFPNPNNTRYYFAPSAFNLKKGEGYYQNVYFLMNSANYGVTDHFSIGGGIIIPFAVYVTPKVNFKITEKFYAGAGVLLGLLPETSPVGITYGLTTYGSNEHNITLGVGYGFYDEEFSDRPIITVNGMTRISRQLALVTENWSIPFVRHEYNEYNWDAEPVERKVYDTYFSYGLRMMFGEKITIDVALVNSKDIVEYMPVGVPYVDFVYKF